MGILDAPALIRSQADKLYADIDVWGVNVKNRRDPLKNAIADGSAHHLSERFANLGLAQTTFPRATALTEEIDRHAIQDALDHFAAVYAPEGTYISDAAIYGSSADTARGLGNQTFNGAGEGATIIKARAGDLAHFILASGNLRGITTGFISLSAVNVASCPNFRIQGFSADGNKANVTDVSGSGGDNIFLVRCDYGLADRVETYNSTGAGIVNQGVTDDYVQGFSFGLIHAHDNGSDGVIGRQRNRKVTYGRIIAHDNGGNGVYCDHSEGTIGVIEATYNAAAGFWAHGTFAWNFGDIRAVGNGQHGILVSGCVDFTAGKWLAMNNSSSAINTYNDVHFDGEVTANYGATKRGEADIICGPTSLYTASYFAREQYGVYVDDAVTDLDLRVRYVAAGMTGKARLPANATVRHTDVALSIEYRRSRATDGPTINTSAADTTDDTLTFRAGANEVWSVEYLLVLSAANATMDAKFKLTGPSGVAGFLAPVTAAASTATGGAGSEVFGAQNINSYITVGTFSGSPGYVVRLAATIINGANEGAVSLLYSQAVTDAGNLILKTGSSMIARRIS